MPYKGEAREIRVRATGSVIGSWAQVGAFPGSLNNTPLDDTSYITAPGKDLANYGSYARLFMAAVTLASNERCVQYRPRVKMTVNASGGSGRKTAVYLQIREQGSLSNPAHPAALFQYIPTQVPSKDYAAAYRSRTPSGKELTAARLSATIVQLIDRTSTTFTSTQRIRVTEAYLDIIVNRRPTLTSLTATNTTTSTSPLIGYTWNDLDGDVQNKQQTKIFTTAQTVIPGFSPDTTKPIYDSGVVSTSEPSHQLQSNLVPGVAYTAYVRASHVLGDLGDWWTVWNSLAFTIVLTAPPAPTLEDIGYELAFDRETLRLRGRSNDLLDEDSSFEGGTVGNWSTTSGDTLANNAVWAAVGTKSLQTTSVGPGAQEAGTAFFSASAGRVYWARATVRSAATVRNATVILRFYNAAFTQIGSDFSSTPLATSTTVDKDLVLQDVTAPALTRWRRIFVNFDNSIAAEIQRFDKVATGPGAGTPPTWHVGSLTQPGVTGYEVQYADMGREGNIVHPNISSGGGYFNSVDGWFPRNATDTIEVSNEVPAYRGDASIRWMPMTTGSILDIGSRVGEADPYVWAVKPGVTYEHSMKLRPYTGTFLVSVRFVYANASGAAVATVGVENVAVGPDWTEVVPPDTIAPAGSVLCRGQIENKSGLIEIPVFIDDVQMGEFGHPLNTGDPGQGELLEWKPWRRSVDPLTNDFSALIIAQDLVAAQEASLYEHEIPPNKIRLFRVRAIAIISELEVASAWSAILPVSAAPLGNWLKTPLESSLNFQPMINGLRPMSRQRTLRKGVHDIVGRETPVVISSTPSSEMFEVEFVVETLAAWHKLDTMIRSAGPLLLKTPLRQWWFQPVGEPKQDDWTARVDGQGFYRSVTVTCLETAVP